jgi:RNA polymerase sigma-70 factor, ECF subfamily
MTGDAIEVPDELVRAAMAGDQDAVAQLLAVVRPVVVRYCRARLGTNRLHAADDVAQDVCLAVLTGLPRYRFEQKSFLAFVYGIAAHKVVDVHRATIRSRCDLEAEVPDAVDAADGPEQHALRVELSAELRRLLDQLPDPQREILVLRTAIGLSAEETAATIGSTPGAVRVAQHRALAKLRRALAAERAQQSASGGRRVQADQGVENELADLLPAQHGRRTLGENALVLGAGVHDRVAGHLRAQRGDVGGLVGNAHADALEGPAHDRRGQRLRQHQRAQRRIGVELRGEPGVPAGHAELGKMPREREDQAGEVVAQVG